MTVDVYGMPGSAPSRIVFMTCNVIGLKYNYKLVDLEKGEHREPEYLKLNPQRVIPTVVDGDYILSESRPCATYLVSKYAEDDKLYPKNLEVRSRVDQRLYFDMGSFYGAFGQCVVSLTVQYTLGQDSTFFSKNSLEFDM